MKWIAITERLPEMTGLKRKESDPVVVCNSANRGYMVAKLCDGFEFGQFRRLHWLAIPTFTRFPLEICTHWLPIPPHPRIKKG